jgi:hypothetical protein
MAATRIPDRLFHYTCRDGEPLILADGLLKPNRHPYLSVPLVWLTDLEVPDRFGLGLAGGVFTSCDRTEFRFEVDPAEIPNCVWWPVAARRLTREVRDGFESSGAWPAHWWVTPVPVRVLPHSVSVR